MEQQDKGLTKRLKEELPGIFLWALEGLKRLRRNGNFTIPSICTEVLEEYRLESNPARVFITEHLIEADGKVIPCASLYECYQGWSKANGFEALNSNLFGKELRKHLPSIARRRATVYGDRVWCYIGLDHVPTQPSDSYLNE